MAIIDVGVAMMLLATQAQNLTGVNMGRDPVTMQFVVQPLAAPAVFNPDNGTFTVPDGRFTYDRVLQASDAGIFWPAAGRTLHADIDGDGRLDAFTLIPVDGPTVSLSAADTPGAPYRLSLPGGIDQVRVLVPGDPNKNGAVDWYLETKSGAAYLLNQTLRPRIAHWRAEQIAQKEVHYATHLRTVHEKIAAGQWDAALLQSAYYSVGWTAHSWKVESNLQTNPLFPWLSAAPATDCVIDVERMMGELHSDGTFNDFRRAYDLVQYYRDPAGHKVRADFFEAETIPHWEQLGYVRAITESIYRSRQADGAVPTITAAVDKNTWYQSGHPDETVPYPLLKSTQTIAYVPWQTLLQYDVAGDRIVLHPDVVAALPAVSLFAIVNRDRYYPKQQTDIAIGHVAVLIKNAAGEVTIISSSPITDVGATGTVEESVDGFMRARVATPRTDGTLDWAKTQHPQRPWESANTSVGLMFFAVTPPAP